MHRKSPANISGIPVWVVRSAILLAIVLGGYLTFEFGRIQAGYNIVDEFEERRTYENRIHDLKAEIVTLNEQIALLETHREIDREAYQEVETGLVGLQRKIQEQRDAIEFYRGIVSPADGGRGLRVQSLRLSKGKSEREYSIQLVLIQVMQHDLTVKGQVDMSLDGEQDGVATTYALEQLLPEDEDSNWPFSFRYFQNFDRQLVLPDGFVPEQINIEVQSQTRSIADVKQSFLWQTGQSQARSDRADASPG